MRYAQGRNSLMPMRTIRGWLLSPLDGGAWEVGAVAFLLVAVICAFSWATALHPFFAMPLVAFGILGAAHWRSP